jgi:hypothetical protein
MEFFDGVSMANTSKPSIFNDRRSIGSEKELDEYGVWVKSESEEFSVFGHDGSLDGGFPPFEDSRGSALSASGGDPALSVAGAESAKSSPPNADVMLSAALLLKIAEELASIKAELAALKSELDHRRSEQAPSAAPPVAHIPVGTDVAKDEATAQEAAAKETGTADGAAQGAGAKEVGVAEDIAEDEVVEADFDDFTIDEAAVGGEDDSVEDQAFDVDFPENAEFFDGDKSAGKITLTSDELNLLGEDTSESVEELEDPFLADDQDQEKIAFTGDEINDILGGMEVPSESAAHERVKVEEITLDDIPDEPLLKDEPHDSEDKSLDDAFDINIESEVSFDKDESFDIDTIEIEDEPTERPVDLDAAEADDGAEGGIVPAAAIAFDPFGSLPDEDAVSDTELAALNEERDTAAEVITAEPVPANGKAEEVASFADFSVVEDPVSGDLLDDSVESLDSIDSVELIDMPAQTAMAETEEVPAAEVPATETAEAPQTVSEDSPDEAAIIGVDGDPALSQLLDEDFQQFAPALEDTSYLDDEKPIELDEVAPESGVPESGMPDSGASDEALVPPEEQPDKSKSVLPSSPESSALQGVPQKFKEELKTVLSYMDILLESLPEEKIEEFARSEHFEPYKNLFKELGLA